MPRTNSFITVTDQFCGAGGSSIGAAAAGAEVRLAMNHWRLAIETHNTNFPNVDHDCADMSAVDPRRYPSTDILITSPECTNHSLAKGKPRRHYERDIFGNILIDPSEERSRATMWDVVRFAEYHRYNIILVENVVDAARWVLFDEWLRAMHKLGYDHKQVYFNSMFAPPTPQSRDRMYVVFWRRGNPAPNLDICPPAPCPRCEAVVPAQQTWKKGRAWGRYKQQYLYTCPQCRQEVTPFYFAAMNVIDWSIPAERIGERKRPLKEKTLARIRYGLETYGRQPLIVTGRYTSGVECRVKQAAGEPLPTQPGDYSHALLAPFLFPINQTGERHRPATEPYPTQTGSLGMALVAAGFLSRQYGGQADPRHLSLGLGSPTGTVTTWDHHALVGVPPMMVSVNDFDPRALNALAQAGGTQTTQDKWAVAIPPAFIAELHGQSRAGALAEALLCVTASGGNHALVSADAFLTYYYGNHQASGMGEAVRTVTGTDRAGLVQRLDALTVDDLTFRMLQPHEIGRAMAFPSSYVVLGNQREKVRQYGNAVTPPVMRMLIERCVATLDGAGRAA